MLTVTWWSVSLTLRLFVSLCLPLSVCGVLDCEVLLLLLCFHNILITTFSNMTRRFFSFVFPLTLESSFFSLIADDTNWFPKENMFSFQTATTTMQAWVSSFHIHKQHAHTVTCMVSALIGLSDVLITRVGAGVFACFRSLTTNCITAQNMSYFLDWFQGCYWFLLQWAIKVIQRPFKLTQGGQSIILNIVNSFFKVK